MSVLLIDPGAVRVEEAAPKFDLAPKTAPMVPGRVDGPLDPTGDGYLGANSQQLAGALCRRYPGMTIKALYTGDELEHAVAVDPKTGLAHDARGTFPSASSAFDGFGATGARGSARVESAPASQAGDDDADAYVARHWAPYENGGSSKLGGFQLDHHPDGHEMDAVLGSEPRPPKPRVLAEARVLSEAIWNEKLHPRWPHGTHDASGKNIGGQYMRVGQRFNKDGHEWEVGRIAGNKVIAYEASGDINKVETRVFDTKHVDGVDNALPGAEPAKPRVLKGGFKPGTKTTIPDENTVIVDAARHEETHDPAIQPHPLSKLTPEQWSHFGRADQLYYNHLMEHFGAWEVNGHKPPSLASATSQWSAKLSQVTNEAPPDAVSTFASEVGSLKGKTSGAQLSGVGCFSTLYNDPAKLAKAQEKYQRFREYEGDINGLLAWDLYNRVAAPDITVVHKASAKEIFKSIIQGKQSMLSGLSTSWKGGVWKSEKNSFVMALPVRNVAFFETLLGQGWGSGSSEFELANIDRLKMTTAGYYAPHELDADQSVGGQASAIQKWLEGKLNVNGQGGWVANALKKHFDKNDEYTVDLGDIDANFQLVKVAGAKTYFIPPDEFMSKVEDAVAADNGTPAWGEQKAISDWPAEYKDADGKVKPGLIITKGGQQEGTRYLVIQNDALGPNEIQYVPLLTGSHDYDVKPTEGGYKTTKAKVVLGKDGKPLFFEPPPPPAERTWSHDMASLAPSGPKIAVGSMDIGSKVAINDDHWKVTKQTGTKVTLQSLSDGSEAKVDSLWKTQQLYPTGQGAPDVSGVKAPPPFKPAAGKTAIYGGTVVDVGTVGVGPNQDQVHITLPNGDDEVVPAATLSATPELPKLTPQKGDTFAFDGTKMTVTNVLKNGTVSAKGGPNSNWPKVIPFSPDNPALEGLFRPGDHEHGPKQKLGTMDPGTVVSGSPKTVHPYQVLGTIGKQTYLKNLETGEVTHVSSGLSSYPPLVPKGTAPTPSPTAGHDAWTPGMKVASEDLQIGDKINTGPPGADWTVSGESMHQGEWGWQLADESGTDAWIPKDLTTTGGNHFTYLGKGEPAKAPPVTTAPSELLDATEHGGMVPYKWHKGGGGQKYPKLNTLPEGQHFYDKNNKLWKVKQGGSHPVITDGEQLYQADGKFHVNLTTAKLDDHTGDVSEPLSPQPNAVEQPSFTKNYEGKSLQDLNLAAGDKFGYGGHTWTVDTLASGGSGNLTAYADDAAMTKAFHGFAIPDSYSKAPPVAPAAHPVPPGIQPVMSNVGGVPVKATADLFAPNELAQRDDGTIVYRNAGGAWMTVGGGPISIPDSESLTALEFAANKPDDITSTDQSLDVHDIPAGQTFFAQGQPFLMLGHGPAGATAVHMKTGVVLEGPKDQHANFKLGSWSAREPSPPPIPEDSALHSMIADYEAGTPGQYGAWSIKKTTENGTGMFFHDQPVAWKDATGQGHFIVNNPDELWPDTPAPQEVVNQLKQDHPGHEPVPQTVLNAIPLADAPSGVSDAIPHTTVQSGATVPGPGIANVMDVQKGHHIKLKTDGTGAEYEVLATPKPGDTTIQVHHLKSGKVYTPKIWASKQVLVTQAPPAAEAPAPEVPHMVPNWDSIGSMGVGDYFGEGGSTYRIENVTKDNVVAKNLTTGVTTTLHKGFVPEKAPAQAAPEPPPPPPPSAPIPAVAPKTLGDLNVGDKYEISDEGWDVTAKGPEGVTVKHQGTDTEVTLPHDQPFSTPPTITYKAPPPAGANQAGHIGAPPLMADMPIQPYLWHKSGSKSYPAISDLAPGEQFTDKKGDKYTVYKHNVKKLGDPVATTTVQGPSGGMIDIPQTFVNAKGKVNATHVNKLSTAVPAPTPTTGVDDKVAAINAQSAASDFLEGAGHTPADIAKLNAEAKANAESKKYPSGWSTSTVWSQAYADAYVDTYGEDASTIDMGNSLFHAVKDAIKDTAPDDLYAKKYDAQEAAKALMSGDVKSQGDWHTELVGPPGHKFTMVLYHGTGDDKLPVAYSDENGVLHVTPVKFKPEVAAAVNYLKAQEPNHVVAAGQVNLKAEIDAAGAKPEPTTWAELRVGDIVKTGGAQSSSHPFKIVGEKGDQWEIESQHDGSKTTIPKASTLSITVLGHEHVDELPHAISPEHRKAMQMADKWMKGQNMTPEDIATIHKNVAAFHAEHPEFPLGDTYATAIGDKKNASGWQVSSPWGTNSLSQTINDATKPKGPKPETKPGDMVLPHEMDVGDTFEGGGQLFKALSKSDAGTEYGTLDGSSMGILKPSASFKLVSKGVAPAPPTAPVEAIPEPKDAAHKDALNGADEWLLSHSGAPTSRTVNWIHQKAAEYKEQYPGWSWGEAYQAATHDALPDVTPDGLVDLHDHVEAAQGKAPEFEPLPQPTAGPGAGIPDYTALTHNGTDLTITGGAGGTTGAKDAVDQQGKKWLVKSYGGNENRVATELLANAVYRTMGHNAADAGVIDTPEGKKLAYVKVDGKHVEWRGTDQAKMKALGQGIMTDALVGNWDFAGTGGPNETNILWNGNDPTRIDQGGSFFFRAQGQSKDFGSVPLEVKSLMTGGGQGVKGVSVSEQEMRQQAGDIAKTLTPEKIDQLVDAAPFSDSKMKEDVRKNLKARVQWMKEFADGQHSDMLQGVKLAPNPAAPKAPEPLPQVQHLFDATDWTDEHKAAHKAAHNWLVDKGVSNADTTLVHQQAMKYHDEKGADWPTAYSYAAGDVAAPQLNNEHAQISGPIEKALGTGASEPPKFGGNDPFDALAVGDHFDSSGGTWKKTGPNSATLVAKTDPNQMVSEGEDVNFGWKGSNVIAAPKPVPADTPSYAAKYRPGHHVSYVTGTGGGSVVSKTGTIVKDTSMSATQHSYLMDNGDKVHEDSISGKVAPIPEPSPTALLKVGGLNVGDHYMLDTGEQYEVVGKTDNAIEVKNLASGYTGHFFLDKAIQGAVVIKTAPGTTTGPPAMEDMPIKPFLWHKGGGGQSYPSISTLKPGAHFTDKGGAHYIVVSNVGGVTMAQPIVNGIPGTAIAIPQTFVNKKGKVQPAHVKDISE